MKPKIAGRRNHHNALIFHDVLALSVYCLHFVFMPAMRLIFRLKKPEKYGLDKKLRNGTIFKIKTLNGSIVWIQPDKLSPADSWIKDVHGKVIKRTDRNGKDFSIINGVYIGEKLLKNITDGQTIKVRAIQQKDERWTAICVAARF